MDGDQRGARVVVVGNGTSVLDHKHGALIDGFDEVVRFNAYRTDGYEDFTGTKTTMWYVVGKLSEAGGRTTQEERTELWVRPYREVHVHHVDDAALEEIWQEMCEFFTCPVIKVDKGVAKQICDFHSERGYTNFSTGLLAIWELLQRFDHLVLTGFDWWEREAHHYSDDGRRGNAHDPGIEHSIIEKLRSQGKLSFLKDQEPTGKEG